MNEKKLAAIKAAYGEAWEKVKDFVDANNGFCNCQRNNDGVIYAGISHLEAKFKGAIEMRGFSWRPESLRDIVLNNSWIRCDERLPDKPGDYYVCINGEFDGQIMHTIEIRQMFERFPDHSKPSHWQPVILPKPPLY